MSRKVAVVGDEAAVRSVEEERSRRRGRVGEREQSRSETSCR